MNGKKILIVIIAFAVAIIFVTPVLVAPLLKKRITAALNENYPDYTFEIDRVNWTLFPSELTLNKVTISSKNEHIGAGNINGEIASVQIIGFKLLKAFFKKKYEIDEVIISNSHLEGNISIENKEKPPTISPINIQIGNLLFDKINLSLKDSTSAQTFSVTNGMVKIVDLKIEELDTLVIPDHLDFKAQQLLSVSADSMYSYKASSIVYSDTTKTLSFDSLTISPNYKGYDFTARHQVEIDCIEAIFSPISLYQFPATDYFNSGNLVSSYIEIGNMKINIFRDKRKEDNLKRKPAFQEIVYNYPDLLSIDSIGINGGNITYTEHAEKANEPGRISMNELKARIYNVTNDTIYKTRDTSMVIRAEVLLVGKSKMTISVNAKLFDKMNTFSMSGTLAQLEVNELNPMLEKNAFIYAKSATIDKISYNFTGNDTKATGRITMLYHGLDIAIKNKRTDDTTAIKEQIISLIANEKAWNSNPLPGEMVRVGIIDYEKDSTKFFFNYALKSIVSGIKSTIIKKTQKKKNLFQRIFGGGDEKQN